VAVTQSDIDRIDQALASGALTVETDGRRVTYRSIAELQSARAELLRRLDGAAAPPRMRLVRLSASKGIRA
jgi:hypothetical protein